LNDTAGKYRAWSASLARTKPAAACRIRTNAARRSARPAAAGAPRGASAPAWGGASAAPVLPGCTNPAAAAVPAAVPPTWEAACAAAASVGCDGPLVMTWLSPAWEGAGASVCPGCEGPTVADSVSGVGAMAKGADPEPEAWLVSRLALSHPVHPPCARPKDGKNHWKRGEWEWE
jgi:hypothetical protein